MPKRSFSIKATLVSSALFVCLVLLAIGAVGVTSLRRLAAADRRLFEWDALPLAHLLVLDESFQCARVNVRDYATSKAIQDRAHYRERIAVFRRKMVDEAAVYHKGIRTAAQGDAYAAWETASSGCMASEEEAMKAADTGHVDEALAILLGPNRVFAQEATDALGKLSQLAIEDAIVTASGNGLLAEHTTRIVGGLVVAGTLLALVFSLWISLSIAARLRKGVRLAESIASGDLTRKLVVDRWDELGDLGQALNNMTVNLSDMIVAVQQDAEQVTASGEQLSRGAHQLSEGAQSQASSLEQTSASVEELTASIELVAQHARSQATRTDEGTTSMTVALESFDQISNDLRAVSALARSSMETAGVGARAVNSVVEGIGGIAGSSEKIGGIVNVISEIADQTSLLALNASIEAARAGQHGRSFAVVASEVSKLADRSAASTKDISLMIKETIASVGTGVETARQSDEAIARILESSKAVHQKVARATSAMEVQVGAAMNLVGALQKIAQASWSISASTEEQTRNAKQISQAIEQVSEVTQSFAAAAEQLSSSTTELSMTSSSLHKLTERFKIEGRGRETQSPAGPTAKTVAKGEKGADRASLACWARPVAQRHV